MQFDKLKVNEDAIKFQEDLEKILNFGVRGWDTLLGTLGLGGRKADYDDLNYEFVGGANDELRKKHYDKSFRLLWKAENNASWSTFQDCTKEEKAMMKLAEDALKQDPEELAEYERMKTAEFRQFLNEQYTKREKEAIVKILTLIGHGEAYAWLVSNELLRDVKTTGGKAALTMQVMEEAKHFVVLRELIRAFDVEVPRMLAWEYIVLEKTLKSKGLDKFFGMNVLVEAVALSLFGAMSKYPGLEILKLFHRDEARHTGLPANYFKTQPMTWWDKVNPAHMTNRLFLFLPAVPMAMMMEAEFAELGVDVYDFLGSVARKIIHLSYRVGFYLPMTQEQVMDLVNFMFNAYCFATRPEHEQKNFLASEATKGEEELAVEREVFQLAAAGA